MSHTAVVAGVEVDTRHWIGGERIAGASTFPDLSPIDGEVIADVARGGQAEADAVVAARSAFLVVAHSAEERATVLHRSPTAPSGG
jgi:5-carboxymethyl-2-hydroxymuconic-semialdehyde dehydrogenase